MNVSNKPGIYIHIPFCKTKCEYCDFYSIEDQSLIDSFLGALYREIEQTSSQIDQIYQFDTIYFGGGTPSLLDISNLEKTLDLLSKNFIVEKNCEITIEANPGTISLEYLKKMRRAGINRISIGVQSFLDHELKLLGRTHTSNQAIEAIINAREAGFDNINLDLIFALPSQSKDDWNYSQKKALTFLPEHLSVYNITYESGTPFYKKLKQNIILELDENKEISYFESAHKNFTNNGYTHYEISNYARSISYLSRHNYKYWHHVPYLGFGPSAHSLWEDTRWENVRSVEDYISQLRSKELPRYQTEKLDQKKKIFEFIFLTLRTYQGLPLNNFQKQFGIDFTKTYAQETKFLVQNRLAAIQNDYFKLTEKGMLICDEILPQFADQ
jgi:oxygen-independent coproporphyrinogen-3 oxidase